MVSKNSFVWQKRPNKIVQYSFACPSLTDFFVPKLEPYFVFYHFPNPSLLLAESLIKLVRLVKIPRNYLLSVFEVGIWVYL